MAKFVVVQKAPDTLSKDEMVIGAPNFLEQIRLNARKAPKVQQTANTHLREILDAISLKFDPELNAYGIRVVNFLGVPYADEAGLNAIIVSLIKAEHPQTLDKVLDFQLKNRPMNIKLIYFVGNLQDSTQFFAHGIDMLEEKDLESFLTGKSKRVGKSAVTKEEADARSESKGS
jgi:hypothetical protein